MTAWSIGPLTDAVRLWGGFSALIGMSDFAGWLLHRERPPMRRVHGGAVVQYMRMGLTTFLLLAGFAIPLSTRVDWMTSESPAFLLVMLLAWICISSAGWLLVLSFTERWRIMLASSLMAFAGCVAAAFLTAVAP